jgi:hypothetical protein
LQAQAKNKARLYLKNNHRKKELEVWLKWQSNSLKHEAMNSNPSTTKKNWVW